MDLPTIDESKRQHTIRKWKLLERYIAPWLQIVSRHFPRAVYVDAFAGAGAWVGHPSGARFEGSPLIAARAGAQVAARREHFRLELIAVEVANRRADQLRALLAPFAPDVREGRFEEEFPAILRQVSDARVPSLWFVDPDGMEAGFGQMREVRQLRSAELLFNYSAEGVRRVVGAAVGQHKQAAALGRRLVTFGFTERPEEPADRDEQERLALFVGTFREWKPLVASMPFQRRDRQPALYHFIFATDNNAGFSIMKDQMWKLDREGTLFAGIPPDPQGRVEAVLEERFGGQTVTWADIHVGTSYHHSKLLQALRSLQRKGLVSCAELPENPDRMPLDHEFSFEPTLGLG